MHELETRPPPKPVSAINKDFLHAPSLAVDYSTYRVKQFGAIFFIITLGLQQIDFYVPTENRRVLLICKLDSKSKGTV